MIDDGKSATTAAGSLVVASSAARGGIGGHLTHHTRLSIFGALLLLACGGAPSSQGIRQPAGASGAPDSKPAQETAPGANEFQIKDSTTAGSAHGATPSKIEATATHAAMKFFVVDKVKNEPTPGMVISLQAPDGKKYYTEETDELGYGEVLVPVGKTYELVYLSLGEKDITAKVTVKDEPRQNIKLTLRYKRRAPMPAPPAPDAAPPETAPAKPAPPVFRLDGVTFESASAEILPESFPRLDSVVEYMTYKKSARIEVSGHTDNVGSAKKNKALSEERAQACRDYLVQKGIDGSRIEAVGRGDEQPIASNDTEEGRRENRRIEAREL